MRASVVFSLLAVSQAIVRRSDVADSQYTANASAMPHIVMINPGESSSRGGSISGFNVECAGTMISRKHAITAAHCFEGASTAGFKVHVKGSGISVAATHFNPNCKFNLKEDGPNECDVAIVELAAEADLEPVPVYQWDDEVGRHMDIYGWGVTGDAATITSKACDDGAEDGNFRHGENTVDHVSEKNGGGIIYYTMSENDAADSLPLESISASGDSGGPAFLTGADGRSYIAGTNSGSADKNGCKYGATDQYCRLSRHYGWIRSVIGDAPAPSPAPVPTPVPTPTLAPTPSIKPQGKCTQRCLDWTIKTCPVDKYPTYNKCFKCGDKLDEVDVACPKLRDQEDCCHTLTDWASETVSV